jgi:hypothetical protein
LCAMVRCTHPGGIIRVLHIIIIIVNMHGE